jgi:hypothetical protein
MSIVRSGFWLGLVGLFFTTTMAWAGIAPQTEEEMEALSSLVVEAEVVSVAVVGVTEVPGELQRVHLEATLEVTYDYLGGSPATLSIPFNWDFIQPEDLLSCGFTEPAHWVGEKAKYYLWDSGEGTYGQVSYDSLFELEESDPQAWTHEEILEAAYPTEEPPIENPPVEPTDDPSASTTGGGCTVSAQGTPGSLFPLVLFAFLVLNARRRQQLS